MQFSTLTLSFSLAALLPLAFAQGSPNEPGFYNTIAQIYSGPNCEASTLVWADPIFGRGGMCQLLDRNDNTPDILSYMVLQQYPGCTATLYADDGCLSKAFPAAVGECVSAEGGMPFVRAFVECPFSE